MVICVGSLAALCEQVRGWQVKLGGPMLGALHGWMYGKRQY